MAALIYGTLLGGTIMIEYVFSWQGFGQWALRGLVYRDYPVIQAFAIYIAVITMVLCPSRDETSFRLSPACSPMLADVCRRS